MIKGLEETSNGQIKLPEDLALLESEDVNKYLREACEKFDVKCPPPQTTTRLLDKVLFKKVLNYNIYIYIQIIYELYKYIYSCVYKFCLRHV